MLSIYNKISIGLSLLGISIGFFLISPNLTGRTIEDIPISASNSVGLMIIILGVVGLFLWLNLHRARNADLKYANAGVSTVQGAQ